MGSISAEQALKETAQRLTPFEGGATRSSQDVRYDLISPHGLTSMGRRLALGAARHGERNWEKAQLLHENLTGGMQG